MTQPERISIREQAARLTKPFTMIDLAQVDDLVISVYLCQGTMPFHRHLDQDELFLVHSGMVTLESDWGSVVLRPGELAVVRKAVLHRSSSMLRSPVVLLQPRLMVNRRNGDRRLFVERGEGRIEKVSLMSVGRQIVAPHRPVVVAHLDTFAVTVMHCHGTGPWTKEERQSSLVLCHAGQVNVDTGEWELGLSEGELVVVPNGETYRLSGPGALVLGVRRHPQPGLPLPE